MLAFLYNRKILKCGWVILIARVAKLKENIKYRSERYLPYVYTEQGISMLAGILKNEIAIQVSISIMRAFVEMRKFIGNNGQVFERLTNVEYKLLVFLIN